MHPGRPDSTWPVAEFVVTGVWERSEFAESETEFNNPCIAAVRSTSTTRSVRSAPGLA